MVNAPSPRSSSSELDSIIRWVVVSSGLEDWLSFEAIAVVEGANNLNSNSSSSASAGGASGDGSVPPGATGSCDGMVMGP